MRVQSGQTLPPGNVLVLTTVLPTGARSGGEIVSQSLIEALLGAGHDTRVVGYRRSGDKSPGHPTDMCAGTRPIETANAPVRAVAWMTRALVTGSPFSVAKFQSRSYSKTANRAFAADPSVVIVDHAQAPVSIAGLARRASPAPTVFMAHNVERASYAALAAAADQPVRRWLYARESRLISAVEMRLVKHARQVWTLTEADADHFRGACPTADVRTLEVASRMPDRPITATITHDVGLIGRWDWEPNALGLRWFASELLPRLPEDLTVEIAGAGADWLRGRHRNVLVHGVIDDARRFLAGSRVVAIPSVTGSGVQIKTLDAIASGRPVVATPTAVRGIAHPPSTVSVGETADEFAAKLEARVRATSQDGPDPEALSWSLARRLRFARCVESWLEEIRSS